MSWRPRGQMSNSGGREGVTPCTLEGAWRGGGGGGTPPKVDYTAELQDHKTVQEGIIPIQENDIGLLEYTQILLLKTGLYLTQQFRLLLYYIVR